MPRRPKIERPQRAVAPTKELANLFGRNLNSVDPSGWLRWFLSDEDRGRMFRELVGAGCDQNGLAALFTQLHFVDVRDTCSAEEIERSKKTLTEAIRELNSLAASDLASVLGFVSTSSGFYPRFEDLASELQELVDYLGGLPMGFRPSRKARVGRRLALASLVRYVQWATGKRNDELLEPVLKVILGEEFSLKVWRRDYPKLWKGGSELEKWWDERVADGEWPEPKRQLGRKRLH